MMVRQPSIVIGSLFPVNRIWGALMVGHMLLMQSKVNTALAFAEHSVNAQTGTGERLGFFFLIFVERQKGAQD